MPSVTGTLKNFNIKKEKRFENTDNLCKSFMSTIPFLKLVDIRIVFRYIEREN